MSNSTINWPDCAGLPEFVFLASKSPRRLELLKSLGISVEVFLAKTGAEAEALEQPFPAEDPVEYVKRVTQLKLDLAVKSIGKQATGTLILASDTTVAIGKVILGKPANPEEARHMLQSLSGNAHQVHTAVAVAHLDESRSGLALHTAEVEFESIPARFIEAYIESGEPFDKAGGYGIQGIIGQYVRRINGSHSGIMGLPLYETAKLLRQFK